MINILDIFGNIKNFFYGIGYFGEYITFTITIYLLFSQTFNMVFYIFMFILDRLLNNRLKDIFKQERPDGPKKFLDDDQFSKKKYGMPSGHTELSFFSLMYAYLNIKRITTPIIIMIITCAIIIYERLIYRNHTLMQLLVGALIGIVLAYISYGIYIRASGALRIK